MAGSNEGELGFDPDALRAKYREERDKRLRPEGIDQYVSVSGDFSHYIDDPYVEPGYSRAPLTDEVEVVIIGGGLAGLSAAAHLRMSGVKGLRIIEKAGDFGGTWYWNRFPGVQCDIDSYVYMPLLEETGYMPSQKYAPGAEILAHAQRIGRTFDLYRDVCFQTQVKELRWIDKEQKWSVRTDQNDKISARFVIKTNSPLDRPKLPGISGIDRFKGHTFHTSRWDYAYTGGDATGALNGLSDKRVAVVGTGGTAIQCIPILGKYAKQLYVFQRTPSSVDERRNCPTEPEWAKGLTPGWQKRRRRNFISVTSGGLEKEDLVRDAWTETVQHLGGGFLGDSKAGSSAEEGGRIAELRDFQKMNQIRARVDASVGNRRTAEALKPWYRQFCKRPTFSDDYLPTFNRTNVTLVDTNGRGVEEVTETAILFDGQRFEVDCIIFATGFEVGTGWAQRAGCEVYGRNGLSLDEHWKDGLKTLHGFYTHGFPNLFHMGVTQNGASYSYTFCTDEQAEHIADLLRRAQARGIHHIEPTVAAEEEWVATIRRLAGANVQFFRDCTPGYFNNEGRTEKTIGFFAETYGGGPIEFYDLIRKWRTGNMEGLQFL